jgi:ketosteroid isomerase-like protein
MSEHLHAFLSHWTKSELAGDTETLATLLTDEFSAVGPLGFILPRPAWLDRHRQGLAYEEFGLEEIQIHLYGDVAVVTARNTARGTYQRQPLPEALRATLVIASNSEAMRLAAIHLSFIAGTKGAPGWPGATNFANRSDETNVDREER